MLGTDCVPALLVGPLVGDQRAYVQQPPNSCTVEGRTHSQPGPSSLLVSGRYRCTLAVVPLMLVQSLQQPLRDVLDINHNQHRTAKSGLTNLPTVGFPKP
jgi:hypothetical protein